MLQSVDISEVRPADAHEDLIETLLRLQRAAYAVEARIIGDDRIPALHEDAAGLRAAPLRWLVARMGPVVVGAIAWSEPGDAVEIDRLVVAPRAHRRGVGTALVHEVLHRAGNRSVTVSTGRGNTPAGFLYQRLGFTPAGDEEVLAGLWVTRYILTQEPRPSRTPLR